MFWLFLGAVPFKLLNDAAQFVGPFFLNRLLDVIQTGDSQVRIWALPLRYRRRRCAKDLFILSWDAATTRAQVSSGVSLLIAIFDGEFSLFVSGRSVLFHLKHGARTGQGLPVRDNDAGGSAGRHHLRQPALPPRRARRCPGSPVLKV